MRGALVTLLLTLTLAGTSLAGDDNNSSKEINYLLSFVASSGCTFTRNSADHTSPDAADHLRLKYTKGKRYVDSAEQFIDRLASESSWTGKPYSVTCQGDTQSSAQWLYTALAGYRERQAQTKQPTRTE